MSSSQSSACSSGSADKNEVLDSASVSIPATLPEGASSLANTSEKTGYSVHQSIWNQMNLTLTDLEYLNSPYSASILTATENLMEEFGKIQTELTTVEARLAKRAVVKMKDLNLATKFMDRHTKLMDRVYDTLKAVCLMERISAKARVFVQTSPSAVEELLKKEMIRMKGTDAGWECLTGKISVTPGPMSFPLASSIQKIFEELHRRVTDWVNAVTRRVMHDIRVKRARLARQRELMAN